MNAYQGNLHPGDLLIDDLVGTKRAVRPGQTLTIGRLSEFVVGQDDTSLHRAFLQVWHSGSH